MAQDVLAETQSAILPLVPYLDTLRWVLIAVALIGIAVEVDALPESALIVRMLIDYAVLRDQAQACR